MTEQTQTTESRIDSMIDAAYTTDSNGVILESNFWRVARDVAAEIDALTAERDEARADLAKCGADLQYEFDNPGDSRRRIAELEAEAERLRPAAEAWEASEAWSEIVSGPAPTMDELDAASARLTKALIAARARAAKESQP